MPSQKTNPANISERRKRQLDAVRIQLGSQMPSAVWRGMEQVRLWLQEDPDDQAVYVMLLDVVQDNRAMREKIRNLLLELSKNSKSAASALRNLPSSAQDLLTDADDAYYAGQYDDAIQSYRQVLKLDPENIRAKDHLAKAELKRMAEETDTDLPKAAEQYYRRARSYIAAQDVSMAVNLLSAAIEAAKKAGKKYEDAERALNNMQDLLISEEYRQKAKNALEKKQRRDALEYYEKAIKLDPTNVVIKKERNSLQLGLAAELVLRWLGVVILVLFVGIAAFRLLSQKSGVAPTTPTSIFTTTIFLTPTNPNVSTFVISETPSQIISPIAISTPTMTATATMTPVPTDIVLGTGFVTKGSVHTWDQPNGVWVDVLGLFQVVTVIEQKEDGGFTWYRCRWEVDGLISEGWILAEYVQFGSPPTPGSLVANSM